MNFEFIYISHYSGDGKLNFFLTRINQTKYFRIHSSHITYCTPTD